MHQRLFQSFLGLSLLGSLAMVGGCSVEAGNEPSPGPSSVGESSVVDPHVLAELEAKVNSYAQSLLINDTGYLDVIVSSEVKLRARQMDSDVRGFATKMRKSLRAELERRGIDADADLTGLLTIGNVTQEGAALRVEVSIDGVEIGKPFYFVAEDGEYKLNVKRPGFTKPLPAGAEASRDTYRIESRRHGSTSFKCTGTATFSVPSVQLCESNCEYWVCDSSGVHCEQKFRDPTPGVSNPKCDSTCGWWTGSTFTQGSNSKKCDYNTWGTDVYINWNNTWNCNDDC